jgi:hypothetical protein
MVKAALTDAAAEPSLPTKISKTTPCKVAGDRRRGGSENARKHGLFTKVATAERKRIEALLAAARKMLQELK